jgi:cytochrome c-type biogenesis protein CcmH/NrfG
LTTLARKTTSATGKLKAKRQKAKREIYLTSSEIQLRHPEYTRWKRPEEDRVRLEGFVLSPAAFLHPYVSLTLYRGI